VGSEDFTVTEIKIMVVWIMILSKLIDPLDFSHHMYCNIYFRDRFSPCFQVCFFQSNSHYIMTIYTVIKAILKSV